MTVTFAMDSDYVCSLSADDLKKAKKELNEDPINRLGAVRKLREWIEEQPHISFPTDTQTLLVYLRHAKFSQLRAREVIEKNCVMKTELPQWFDNHNTNDQLMVKFLKTGYVLVLPGRGDKGQCRIVYRINSYDLKEWENNKMMILKASYMVFFYLLMNEATQVCGIELILDYTGATMAHQTYLGLGELKKFGSHFSHALPLRMKRCHFYNTGALIETLMSLLRPLFSKKLQSRWIMHVSDLTKLYKYIDKECLPVEFLPDDYSGPNAGTIQSLTDELISNLQQPEVQEHLTHMTQPEWGINLDKIPKQRSLAQSFRRLSVS